MLDFEFDETGKVVRDLKRILMFGSFCLGKKGGQTSFLMGGSVGDSKWHTFGRL